ncbi:paraquat-inducible protein A, partial [Klebsiella pneumoniae]|nr:paraquat-inducible protein A [Klebsiella pneumoniae]
QGLLSCACCTAVLPVDQTGCPRCNSKVTARRKNSLQWTLALLVTAFILYLLAKSVPIMITDLLGDKMPWSVVAGGVLLCSE